MRKKTYAYWVVLLPLLLLVSIAVFNRFIDPYQIFNADRQAVYVNKPALHGNMRLHKAYQVRLQKPDTLILGSSKAIQGIPTDHAFFKDSRVYNLAMPLASMKELTYLLRHANEVQTIKKVVIGLDFLSFNVLAREDGPASGFVPARLLGSEYSIAQLVQDYLSALTSLDALKSSIGVWRINSSSTKKASNSSLEYAGSDVPPHRILTGLGGRNDIEIRSRLKDGGHRSNTLKIEEFFTSAVYLPSPLKRFSFQSKKQNSLYWFEQFLHTAYENNIELTMFISPSHARLNELIDAAGLTTLFERWKHRLLALNTLTAKEYGHVAYNLWDFSAPSTLTTEPFPEAGDSEYRMTYFYEAIHYNQRTGSLVLDRIYEDELSQEVTHKPHTFGVKLTGDNINAVLGANQSKQNIFRQQYPAHRKELDSIMRKR